MSGLYVPAAGCVHLDPNNTLAYVRSRHTQFYENGRWRNDPLSDLSRLSRQQDFMRRLIARIKKVRNPFEAKRVVDGAVRYFKLDDKFSIWDALRLARAMRGVAPETLHATTLPLDNINVGGAAELRTRQPEASAVIDSFVRGPSVSQPTAQSNPGAASPGRATAPSKC
jgi:anionic cell wall polymer biosynthesis LytR-Cps2A-Psr (LCP) family protein